MESNTIKNWVVFMPRTQDMRVPKLSELEVGMEFYVVMEGDPVTVYKDKFRGRLNEILPGRFFSERKQEWTDRATETQEEYEEGYLSWVKFLVKNKRLLIK